MNANKIKICKICLTNDEDDNVFECPILEDFLIQVSGVSHINYEPKNLYNFTIHHNDTIDILPEIETIHSYDKNTEFTGKTIQTEMLEINSSKNGNVVKTTEDLKEMENGTKKFKRNYEEFNFDLKHLSFTEQIEHIQMKKQSEKYLNRKYKCEKCGVGFITEEVYLEHSKRHLETSGPHKCKICTLRLASKAALCQHKLGHRRRFICRACGTSLNRWRHCVAHRVKCGGVHDVAICNLCEKVFSNAISLDIHIKGVHMKEKKYVCEQCDKRFINKQRLTVHIRSHTGMKEFACPICLRKFSTNSNLRAHQSVHTDDRKYYCVECDTRYKTQKGLKRHFLESTKHIDKEVLIYKCLECDKKFQTEKSLNYHVKERHLIEHRCLTCSKTFSNKANLKKHMRCVHAALKNIEN